MAPYHTDHMSETFMTKQYTKGLYECNHCNETFTAREIHEHYHSNECKGHTTHEDNAVVNGCKSNWEL